jgi:hypothetical protein
MIFWRLVVMLGVMIVAGCGSNYTIFRENLKIVMKEPAQLSYTEQSVLDNPYDLIAMQLDEQPEVVLALAFAEHNQLKFISADSALVVLQHGRIVKTTGFRSNLAYTSALSADPLELGPALVSDNVRWVRLTDWPDENAYGYQFESDFSFAGHETIKVFERQIPAVRIAEKVNIMPGGKRLVNHYWFAADSGILLKSTQQPAPFWPVVNITYLSQIARHYQPE